MLWINFHISPTPLSVANIINKLLAKIINKSLKNEIDL